MFMNKILTLGTDWSTEFSHVIGPIRVESDLSHLSEGVHISGCTYVTHCSLAIHINIVSKKCSNLAI